MDLALSFLAVLYGDIQYSSAELLNFAIKLFMRTLAFILYVGAIPMNLVRALRKSKKCPAITNKLLLLSATEMAKKIRMKEITSEEVLSAYIARCKEINPIVNALVDERYGAALEEAREVDRFVRSGVKSVESMARDTPLLGIPITIKESIAVKGMTHNSGRKLKEKLIATEDADTLKLAKAAGAIVLAVSNTPELCMCWETYNCVTGTTWNPYDTRKTPGGSSGGEAALLSSAASILSISSDIGGSVRLPAMFCGVFGHKPSPGWIPAPGHIPTCHDPDWPNYFTMGPMVRYAEDLTLFLKTIVKPEIDCSMLNEKIKLSNIKVYYMESFPSFLLNRVDPEIIEGLRKVIHHFKTQIKSEVKLAEIADLSYALEASSIPLLELEVIDTIFKQENEPRKWKTWLKEFIKYLFGMSPHIFTVMIYGLLKKLQKVIPANYIKLAYEKNDSIKRQFQEILGDDAVFICPTYTTAAHFPYEVYPKFCDISYMIIFNTLGFPVTQCPVGLNKNGLPIGIQVVGNAGCDHLTIAVALEIERAFGGWKDPLIKRAVV